jgi:hypothetical protein
MPFTVAEFLSVFEQYDRTLGPGAAVVAYVLGLGAAGAVAVVALAAQWVGRRRAVACAPRP